MKFYSLFLSAAVLATACNSKPDAASTATTPTVDTGMVIVGPEIAADSQQVSNNPPAEAKENAATTNKSTNKSTSSHSSGNQSSSGSAGSGGTTSSDGTASSGSDGSGSTKKGWSKTAKGAVIGGVTGAAAGAVINKKNRGVGAVVGGVTGAAAGAVIGNQMDKKDGRH